MRTTFKSIKIENKEKKLLKLNLFYRFLDNDPFGLKPIYEEILGRGAIKIVKNNSFYRGFNYYVNALQKNYILVNKSDNIYDQCIAIHELGHAKLNLQQIKIQYSYVTNLIEVFSTTLEMLFSEFLKENNLCVTSYNLKVEKFNETIHWIKELYREINSINFNIDNKIFQYKFKTVIGNFLAFELYNQYLINKDKTIENILTFIDSYGNFSDKEILSKIGLDIDILKTNKILSEYSDSLIKEKILLKK